MKLLLFIIALFAIGAVHAQNTSLEPTSILYHDNGFVSHKYYTLETGVGVGVHYSDTAENQIVGGNRNGGKIKFLNNRITEIESAKRTPPRPDSYNRASVSQGQFEYSCVTKGTFQNFELYNGFIYYYDSNGNRTITEKVTNGVIQYNPRIQLQSDKLENIALRHDLNFNGRTEQRELNKFSTMGFQLDSAGIEGFPFNELYKFQKLKTLTINNLRYALSDYSTKAKLKTAIHKQAGRPISRQRDPWDPIPIPFPPGPEPILCDFPDIEAQYPGGANAMFQFLQDSLRYPETATGYLPNQGRVYVSFIVEKDGGVTNVKVERGVSEEFDREAKRLVRSMPNWTPAESKGVICRSRLRLPITFGLK